MSAEENSSHLLGYKLLGFRKRKELGLNKSFSLKSLKGDPKVQKNLDKHKQQIRLVLQYMTYLTGPPH